MSTYSIHWIEDQVNHLKYNMKWMKTKLRGEVQSWKHLFLVIFLLSDRVTECDRPTDRPTGREEGPETGVRLSPDEFTTRIDPVSRDCFSEK